MPVEEITLPVEHVSDTAYMVALLRAFESEREDARFRDPYASLLAAPKADDLTKRIPFVREGQWLMTIRTCLLDEQILRLLGEGVNTVINMAAGLDTRPYRLPVPPETHWVEVDFPAMINYKSAKLSAVTPHCRLERVCLDLTDDKGRRELISKLGASSKKILIITEGLLYYLPEATVTALARELEGERTVSHWLMDTISVEFMAWMREHLGSDKEEKSDVKITSFRIEAREFFTTFGWKLGHFDSFAEGSRRYGRNPPANMTSDPRNKMAMDESGIALFEKIATQ